jgi:FkbM family methyltransferase
LYGIQFRGMKFFSRSTINHEDTFLMLQTRGLSESNSLMVQHARYIIKPSDHIVEVGAFEGFYSIMVANILGKTGRISACEIMPEATSTLKLNYKENNVSGEVITKGVSPRGGISKVYSLSNQLNGLKQNVIASYAQDQSMREIIVQTITLDQLMTDLNITKPIQLLILQINGIESEVLQSFTKFELVENVCFAMKYVNHESLNKIRYFMRKKGFVSEFNQIFMYSKKVTVIHIHAYYI